MLLVFAITVVVLIAIATSSVLVMRALEQNVHKFVENDLPRVRQADALSHLVQDIVSSAQGLSQAQTKTALNEAYANVDQLLLELENITTALSRQSVDPPILNMLVLAQQTRSEAQLGFQLMAGALELEEQRLMIKRNVEQSIHNLISIASEGLSVPHSSQFPLTTQDYVTLVQCTQDMSKALRNSEEFLESAPIAAQQIKFLKALVDIETIINKDRTQIVKFQNSAKDWKTFFSLKQREIELRDTSEELLAILQNTVQEMVQALNDYTDQMIDEFTDNTEAVFALEYWANLLIVSVGFVSLVIITLVQWQIIGRGFSQRLEVISKSLACVPTTADETQVPISGNDEIATMARQLEALLTQALQIRNMATTDELTQVPNRRYFFQQIPIEEERARRSGKGGAVLMLDIDFFKKVNDTYGHGIGDKVLIAVAHTCRKNLRTPDILARMGGEEFIIYCPDTGIEHGEKLAERIRSRIESLRIGLFDEIILRVTVSIGLTITQPPKMDIVSAMKTADKALYMAKEGGRNRVISIS
jgi:diguanylate cyclase (GGDEF)-like protein